MNLSHLLYGACAACLTFAVDATEVDSKATENSDVESIEQLPAEGPKENVRMIKFVRDPKTKKYSCLHFYGDDNVQSFKSEEYDDVAGYLKRDFFHNYPNVHSVIFDGMTFDRSMVSLLEQSGLGNLKLKSVLFNDCKLQKTGESGLSLLLHNSDDLEGVKLGFSNSEEFPHKLLADISAKCKKLNLLCLSFGKLDATDASVVSDIIQKNGKFLRNFYLVVQQAERGILKSISDSLKQISDLNSLSISFGNIPCEDVSSFFGGLSAIKNLKIAKIDMDMGLYDTEGLYFAMESVSTFLKAQPNLEELDISGSNISDDGYAKIFQDVLSVTHKLKILKMDHVKITEKNVDELTKGMSNLPALTEVSFEGCKINDQIFGKAVTALETLPALKLLNLDDNAITTGLSGVVQKCSHLVNLSVRNNKLTANSALDIIKASFDKSRQTQIVINLMGNDIGDKKANLHNEYTKLVIQENDNKPKSFIIL